MQYERRREYINKFEDLLERYKSGGIEVVPVQAVGNYILEICQEQDRDTRHAIAEQLAFHSYAHSIAMNTSAL